MKTYKLAEAAKPFFSDKLGKATGTLEYWEDKGIKINALQEQESPWMARVGVADRENKALRHNSERFGNDGDPRSEFYMTLYKGGQTQQEYNRSKSYIKGLYKYIEDHLNGISQPKNLNIYEATGDNMGCGPLGAYLFVCAENEDQAMEIAQDKCGGGVEKVTLIDTTKPCAVHYFSGDY